MRSPGARIGAGVIAVLIAGAFAASRLDVLQGQGDGRLRASGDAAPEFTGIAGWLNSEPLRMSSLRGEVVLIDFWAYTCVNCVRTFPHLRALHARYAPEGLRIVGVHSPEFSFEREEDNVRAAIERHRLAYPVALDSDMATWRAYGNHWWPHVYLIDAQGRIRFDHIGEGGEDRIEEAVRSLLAETGARLPTPLASTAGGPSANITPEIYAGRRRGSLQGSLGNPEGYGAHGFARVDPAVVADAGTGGVFFLEGAWIVHDEYVEAAAAGARVLLPFRARDVYFVAAPAAGIPRVRASLDGGPVPGASAGADLREGAVRVARSDLFVLVRLPAPETHVLTLDAEPGFRLYTFTFG